MPVNRTTCHCIGPAYADKTSDDTKDNQGPLGGKLCHILTIILIQFEHSLYHCSCTNHILTFEINQLRTSTIRRMHKDRMYILARSWSGRKQLLHKWWLLKDYALPSLATILSHTGLVQHKWKMVCIGSSWNVAIWRICGH